MHCSRTTYRVICRLLFLELLVFFFLGFYHSVLLAEPLGEKLALALQGNVVRINADSKDGFGFIVGEREGKVYIATANHVVRGVGSAGKTSARVQVTFFHDQGTSHGAFILPMHDTYFDLAVIQAEARKDLLWHREVLGSEEHIVRNAPVWFVGREGKWYVPTDSGRLNSIAVDFKLGLDNLPVQIGSSGAPLVSDNGIIGMMISDRAGGLSEALSIEVIRRAFEIWNLPWHLTPLSPSAAIPDIKEKVHALLASGDGFQDLRSRDKASEQYKKALELDHKNVEVARRLVSVARETIVRSAFCSGGCRSDAALSNSSKRRSQASDAEIHAVLGEIYEVQALHPSLQDDSALLLDEVHLLKVGGYWEEAVNVLEKANRLAPNHAEVLAELGLLLVRIVPEQRARGLELLQHALELDPANPAYSFYLGRSLERTNQDSEAVRTYRRTAELSTKDRYWFKRAREGAMFHMFQVFNKSLLGKDKCTISEEWDMPLEERADHLEYLVANYEPGSLAGCEKPHLHLAMIYRKLGNYQKSVQTLENLLPKKKEEWKRERWYLKQLAEILEEGKSDPVLLQEVRDMLKE